jgi:uncharacterized protein (TIGR02466 family)
MECVEIFPTKILTKNIHDQPYIDSLIKVTHELSSKPYHHNIDIASIRNGWQSDRDIYKLSIFHLLNDCVLKEVVSHLLKGKNVTPYITSMWLNVQKQYGFNHTHIHSGSWYSGVYYLSCPEKSGDILFTDPRVGAENNFYHVHLEPTVYKITPKTGDLFLFPGWLPHAVEQNESMQDRISVAFNIELEV